MNHEAWALPLLGAAAVLAALVAAACWRARRALARLGLPPRLAGSARDLALVAALVAAVVALLGPRFGTERVRLPEGGIDLVLLVDVSRSMDASDAPPSRLARAREAAAALLDRLDARDRVALAVFAGRGELLTPLTHDRGALREMLPGLHTEWMADRGSHLAAGVEAALGAFEEASLRPRVVLALGDGERADIVAPAFLEALARAQVRVVAGAIGSERGTTLAGGGGPLLAPDGTPVVTRRELRGFARFAKATGGAVLSADPWGELDASALLAAARTGLRAGPGGSLEREVPAVRWAIPAALAFALLLAELLACSRVGLGIARSRAGPGIARSRALGTLPLALVAVAGLAASPDPGALAASPDPGGLGASLSLDGPGEAGALVALGVARTEAGDAAEGARAFHAALVRAATPEDIALASYDLGVALLELGDFAGARDAFLDTLAVAPGDREAAFNLEWALRALTAEPPPALEAKQPASEAEEASAEPEAAPSEPEAAAEAPPEAETPPPGEGEAAPRPAALTPEEVAQWLDQVQDRPRPAPGAGGPRRVGPQW